MPRIAVVGISAYRARRQFSDHFGAAPGPPIRVRENYQGARIARLLVHHTLVDRAGDFRHVEPGLSRSDQRIGHDAVTERVQSLHEHAHVAAALVEGNALGQGGAKVGRRRRHSREKLARVSRDAVDTTANYSTHRSASGQ